MRTTGLILLLAFTLLLSGCVNGQPILPGTAIILTGSGSLTTKQFDYSDFDTIELGSAFRGEFSQGDGYSVSVTADDNLWQYVSVRKQGRTLQIGLSTMRPLSLRSGSLHASVTLPQLAGVRLSGAAQAILGGFTGSAGFDASLSGASTLNGSMQASGQSRLEASGASRMVLQGQAASVAVSGSGASSIDLSNFRANSASIDLSGASQAQVNASQKLDYNLSGASHVTYFGSPSIGKSETSGDSSVTRR